MTTEEDRERAAKEAAQMHRTWRIQVNAKYRQRCREYYRDRVIWEYSMIRVAVGISGVVWLKNLSTKQIIRLANPRNLESQNDYREVVEEERAVHQRLPGPTRNWQPP